MRAYNGLNGLNGHGRAMARISGADMQAPSDRACPVQAKVTKSRVRSRVALRSPHLLRMSRRDGCAFADSGGRDGAGIGGDLTADLLPCWRSSESALPLLMAVHSRPPKSQVKSGQHPIRMSGSTLRSPRQCPLLAVFSRARQRIPYGWQYQVHGSVDGHGPRLTTQYGAISGSHRLGPRRRRRSRRDE
jgi:hypothetical protein